MSDLKVLVMEPANQHPAHEMARPNGALGPAYIIGALRRAGIHADYLDGTVGPVGDSLAKTFQATWEWAKKRNSFHSWPWGQ